jgi:hypothetical protein
MCRDSYLKSDHGLIIFLIAVSSILIDYYIKRHITIVGGVTGLIPEQITKGGGLTIT